MSQSRFRELLFHLGTYLQRCHGKFLASCIIRCYYYIKSALKINFLAFSFFVCNMEKASVKCT